MAYIEENERLEDNEQIDLFICPPDPNVLTDEDSADEDEGGLVDNLSRRQLLAAAELCLPNNERLTPIEDVDNIDEDKPIEGEESADIRNRDFLKTLKGKKYTNRTWIAGDLIKTTNFQKPDYSEFNDLSPTDLFELFFNDEVLLHIMEESRKYAIFLNFPDPKITTEELKCFLGIMIVSGYNILPGKRFFWDSGTDMCNEMVKEAMRRDRFIQIMRFLHCADNSKIDTTDKMWKLRPLITKLQSSFLKYYQPTENMNYDESMVKYYGRHHCKQFIRGKPIRFGYKVWSLNSENSYLINFDIYQGKSPNSNDAYENAFGKAAAPLVSMLDRLPQKNLAYQVYIDNLFTSFNLLVYLKEKGYGVTGTIRENRVPKDVPLPDKKSMSKESRGHIVSRLNKEDGIMLTRWMDNAVVTMASTSYGVNPIQNVKRYSQSEKKIIQVPRPYVIGKYNTYMGGTDRMDEDLSRYRIGIRSKKWYWPILTWLIDAAIQNAWIIHKCSGRQITNLNFRREIATSYLKKYKNPPIRPGRPATSISSLSLNRVSDDIRYDEKNHLVEPVPNKKRRRCAGEGCSSVGRTQCQKCGVGLCIECFSIFHKK